MYTKHPYWFFQKALSDKMCDDIIATGKLARSTKALTGTGKKITPKMQKKRKSNVSWLDNKWIYNLIHPFIHTANRNSGWNFEWDWSETCQFTIYKPGQFYDWHCDSWIQPYNKPGTKLHGKQRKLSVTVSLSDPNKPGEYEGGNLKFDYGPHATGERYHECTEIRPQGSIIVIPSDVYHQVTPVTKGTRYSLVIWSCGWPLK